MNGWFTQDIVSSWTALCLLQQAPSKQQDRMLSFNRRKGRVSTGTVSLVLHDREVVILHIHLCAHGIQMGKMSVKLCSMGLFPTVSDLALVFSLSQNLPWTSVCSLVHSTSFHPHGLSGWRALYGSLISVSEGIMLKWSWSTSLTPLVCVLYLSLTNQWAGVRLNKMCASDTVWNQIRTA